jgi:hypothetical protein
LDVVQPIRLQDYRNHSSPEGGLVSIISRS